ncbi:MAG TPA: tyrosine-type recombinase/integrase [Candidatus Acidoferrales bacterium]|nr:tyrosine-type recombinase/integrase [Candidatus Acidoferrales bacterium]
MIWEKFLADLRRRNLVLSTTQKHERLGEQMLLFADHLNLKLLAQIDLDTLSTFYGQWTEGPLTRQKKLECLRAFYRHTAKRKWVTENLALDLIPAKINPKPTMPFSRDEMLRILGALNQYAESAGRANAERLRAFVLVLRYSGLRIGDAVQLSADKLHGNKIFLRTAKTGQPVFCPLPEPAITALDAIPKANEKYFFWTGRSTLHSAIGKWQKRLKRLFELACVTGSHAHRFRHTFAVELLLSGVLREHLKILLGHSSVKITERYYAAWTVYLSSDRRHDPNAAMRAHSNNAMTLSCGWRIQDSVCGVAERAAAPREFVDSLDDKAAARIDALSSACASMATGCKENSSRGSQTHAAGRR